MVIGRAFFKEATITGGLPHNFAHFQVGCHAILFLQSINQFIIQFEETNDETNETNPFA